jgi:hypothetical protein
MPAISIILFSLLPLLIVCYFIFEVIPAGISSRRADKEYTKTLNSMQPQDWLK